MSDELYIVEVDTNSPVDMHPLHIHRSVDRLRYDITVGEDAMRGCLPAEQSAWTVVHCGTLEECLLYVERHGETLIDWARECRATRLRGETLLPAYQPDGRAVTQ